MLISEREREREQILSRRLGGFRRMEHTSESIASSENPSTGEIVAILPISI
jgi:hypothetical protein